MSSAKVNEPVETKEFQAEVKKMLDIVIHSLYTERDIFLRELVSNAADALEKFRHQSLLEKEVFDGHVPLEITIDGDDKKHTLTITDTGIGMTRSELEANLGTIAHSGSKTFLTELSDAAQKDVNLIGQFGVGFYAAFMAAKSVKVQSRSYRMDDDGHEWVSDGTGSYTLAPCPGIHRGTRIVLELNDDAHDYAKEATIKRIIKQYSSFVPFPIKVAGEAVNTVQAVWARSKNDIKDEEYKEFYRYIANAMDEPSYTLHFAADAPLAIKTLLFVGQDNFEKLGFGRMDPGVNLYCQKILIEQHSKNILPEWLRFVKGVVDSEDLPLNISRQALQDSALVVKLNKIITSRFLKFLGDQAKSDSEKYATFWKEYGFFLKEGAIQDFTHREAISKLLRFESSKTESGKFISLDEYAGRMQDEQKEIYYISGPNREAIEAGPYIETFRKRDIEIIYTLDPVDDFVMGHVGEFDGKKLISADRGDIDLPGKEEEKEEGADEKAESLDSKTVSTLTTWVKDVLGDKVKEVKESHRLVGSPAIVVNPDGFMTSSMERIMKASGQGLQEISAKNFEINTRHPLIKDLASLKEKDEPFAKDIVEQIFDNSMIQAGLMVETTKIVERSYKILERAVKGS
jgi:molecular chaperone HtpG